MKKVLSVTQSFRAGIMMQDNQQEGVYVLMIMLNQHVISLTP